MSEFNNQKARQKLTDEKLPEFISLYKRGAKLAQLAEFGGISVATAKRRLQQMGYSIKGRM